MTTNPALAPLQFLLGAWEMELSEAAFLPAPDARVHSPAIFEWIDQGAALLMRMGGAGTPTAAWIIAGMSPTRTTTYCTPTTAGSRVSTG